MKDVPFICLNCRKESAFCGNCRKYYCQFCEKEFHDGECRKNSETSSFDQSASFFSNLSGANHSMGAQKGASEEKTLSSKRRREEGGNTSESHQSPNDAHGAPPKNKRFKSDDSEVLDALMSKGLISGFATVTDSTYTYTGNQNDDTGDIEIDLGDAEMKFDDSDAIVQKYPENIAEDDEEFALLNLFGSSSYQYLDYIFRLLDGQPVQTTQAEENIFDLQSNAFSVPQSRGTRNALQQKNAPALGIVTWNMQRVGKHRQGEDADTEVDSLNSLYKLVGKFLQKVFEKINDFEPSDMNLWLQKLSLATIFNSLVGEQFDVETFKANHRNCDSKIDFFYQLRMMLRKIELTATERKSFSKQFTRYRRLLKFESIVEMFAKNPWLDVLIMQEVGLGMDILETAVIDHAAHLGISLKCYSGPLTESYGGYKEFFPIVTRERIKVEECGWSDIDKGLESFEINRGCRKTFYYNRDKDKYRPIIFYKLRAPEWKDTDYAYVGIVHTTPKGSEFDRPEDYEQISSPAAALRKHAGKTGWVIIGGDYYLSAEAIIGKGIISEDMEKYSKDFLAKLKGSCNRDKSILRNVKAIIDQNKGLRTNSLALDFLKEYQEIRKYLSQAKTILTAANSTIHESQIRISQLKNHVLFTIIFDKEDPFEGQTSTMDVYAKFSWLEIRNEIHFNTIFQNLEKSKRKVTEKPKYSEDECQRELWLQIRLLDARIKRLTEVIDEMLTPKKRQLSVSTIPNMNRNIEGLTFAAAAKKEDWVLCQAATATNWKNYPVQGDGVDWEKGRIADFYICTKDWIKPDVQLGTLIPPSVAQGILLADTVQMQIARYWLIISDHIPMAGYFTGDPQDKKFYKEIARLSSEEKFQESLKYRSKGYFMQLELELADFSPVEKLPK